MKKTLFALALIAGLAATTGVRAADNGSVLSAEELDKLTMEVNRNSFHDKGIIKVDEVLASINDPLMRACADANIYGQPMDDETRRKFEQENMETIQWPEDGNYFGDYEAGEKIAQSGRGGTWRDKAEDPAGGNCYNCHQISKEELSFGTIGTSLYNYGKLRGVTDLNDPKSEEMIKYTWGKIYNAKAYDACSNMPRFGSHGILTPDQIRDLMALLLDPESPVNK